MALVNCPDCRRVVSDSALECPACGRVLARLTCPKCGTAVSPTSVPPAGAAPTPTRPLGRELLTPIDHLTRTDLLFRQAIEVAAGDLGTLRDPKASLRELWRATRTRLRQSVPPDARAEYERLTEDERAERQRENAWRHPDARKLHMAMEHLTVRGSEAGAIVTAWFAFPDFSEQVSGFLDGTVSAEQLLSRARARRKQAKQAR